jgi:hypothetical protein
MEDTGSIVKGIHVLFPLRDRLTLVSSYISSPSASQLAREVLVQSFDQENPSRALGGSLKYPLKNPPVKYEKELDVVSVYAASVDGVVST